jgi:hypothetical protein
VAPPGSGSGSNGSPSGSSGSGSGGRVAFAVAGGLLGAALFGLGVARELPRTLPPPTKGGSRGRRGRGPAGPSKTGPQQPGPSRERGP